MKRLLPPLSVAAQIVVLAAIVSPLQAASPTTPRAPTASIAQVHYIFRGLGVQPPGGRLQSAHLNQPLFTHYQLHTSAQQKASIRFVDGTTLHVNTNTDALLRSPTETQVVRGEVAQYVTPGSTHIVTTSTAIAASIGTAYDVEVANGVATFVVLHGALQVHGASGTVVVKNNQETIVRPNGTPGPATSVDARAVFAWTNGIPTPDLGEDVALDANGGSVVSYTSQRDGPGGAGNALHINDGLLSQGWETAQGKVSNQSVAVSFLGSNFYRVSAIIIDPAATYGDPATEDLKDFEIRVSSTDSKPDSFTTVFQGRSRRQSMLQRFTLPVPVRAKYVELVALNNYGSPNRIAVAEWEVVATVSLFAQPVALTTDRAGNVYVADTNSNRIDKLSPSGKLLAAWGSKGQLPGQFLRPQGITVDGGGNIYVADTYNHRIQKLSPQGRTLEVIGTSGVNDGQLFFPRGIAVAANGTIYVSDLNHRIQTFSPAGKYLASWSQFGSAGPLVDPEGLALDAQGNLYVADARGDVTDTGGDRIVKLSSTGSVLATYGKPGSATGELDHPTSVALDAAGNIYVADSSNARIQKIDGKGTFTAWGKMGTGRGQFLIPQGVATDRSGRVFVMDTGNSRIQVFSATGQLRAVWGKYASVPQILGEPGGISVNPHGNIYVTDAVNDRIQQRGPGGQVRAVLGYHGYAALEKGQALGQFWYPHGMAVTASGTIYVADSFNNRIQILSSRGPIAALGKYGSAPGQFNVPEGVAVDSKGNLYVADSGNNRVQKLTSNGTPLWSVGSHGTGKGQFEFPVGIAIDQSGNIYVSDFFGQHIQKLSPSGEVLAVWGDPTPITSRFFGPTGLAVDKENNLYVADSGHSAIQKLAPDGRVLDVFVLPGPSASPIGVAVDSHGRIYAADNLESRIVEFAPTGEILNIWD